jgi:anti-anti-sigma factor
MRKSISPSPADPQDTLRITAERNLVREFCLELEKRFQAEIEKAKTPVVLDLVRVSLIDSSGIALCVGLLKECQKKNLPLTVEVNPDLDSFFRLLKLNRVFQFVKKEKA